MNELFVDILHLVALVNPKDQWHQKSVEVETATRDFNLATTEDILTELLNSYSERGSFMRMKVIAFVRETCSTFASKLLGEIKRHFSTPSNFTNRASTKVTV